MSVTALLPILAHLYGNPDNQQAGPESEIEIAERLAGTEDKFTIQQLVSALTKPGQTVQSEAIKVLYEVGYRKPDLIAEYAVDFAKLLGNKNNRLIWGAMIALHQIAKTEPTRIYPYLATILKAKDEGSVITRDHAVGILAELSRLSQYRDEAIPHMLGIIKDAPINQLPSYAENAASVIPSEYATMLADTLRSRLSELQELPAKLKRVEKVLKKLKQFLTFGA